ncbi:MAG: S41 family peptidase [Candidatus Brevundimonas phytovorans]|nr:PDZ domain-containing protein [Brevundimonas sp.]WEK59347.1 MAG: S41 family peptidase [Brevundimonas sp.]
MRISHTLFAAPLAVLIVAAAAAAQTPDHTADNYRNDALSLPALVAEQYAYVERLPGGAFPETDILRAEAEAVHDQAGLLRYAEHALTALADHHAITGSSFADSWAVTPSYSDLWIEPRDGVWIITAVRAGSPAQAAAVQPGDRLTAVGDQTTRDAVTAFWRDIGLPPEGDRAGYAARVLAAGRRDRPRDLTITDADGTARRLNLPSLYKAPRDQAPVESRLERDALVIRVNDSLGDQAAIAAFDAAMATASDDQLVVIDLSETPSGGNTIVARGIMGWFVDAPAAYQIHVLPAEARATGIERRWVEQVLPRAGKRHHGPVEVRVGRWTGSMGEGLAIGLHAQGARVVGQPMAGLLGAIYDLRLPRTGLVIKLPVERLYAVDGTPREQFRPDPD